MSPSPRIPRPDCTINRLAWEVALDRLELDTILVERVVGSHTPPRLDLWDVPELEGPIPADLLPRALAIQRRQAAAMAALSEGLTSTHRHQAFTDRVTSTSAPALIAPAYVDLSA